jgi:hypothetical protein
MQSTAPTVAKYLLQLPPDRRPAIEAVRRVILANVDKDIEETLSSGMIGYVVPHRVFPGGYHCDPKQPVPYLCLASQKHHMALYLMFAYTGGREEEWIRQQYATKGKRLDMGKSCLRFRTLDDLDLEVLAETIRRVPAQQFIATYVATVGADKWRQGPLQVPTKPFTPAVAAPAPVRVAQRAPAKKKPGKKKPGKKKPSKRAVKKKPAKRAVKKKPARKTKAPARRRRRA